MRRARFREHVRSNVIGYVCLVWLMTGTAVAATQLPSNSVGTKQLRRAAVTASKVRKDTLTGRQIRESSLGPVPSAVSAGSATTAGTAGSATTAGSAGSAGSATTAANAGQLGGSPPDAFQRRVTGTCTGATAAQQVNADGTVTCTSIGKITKLTPGAGLLGGGSSGEVTLSADTDVLQKRVTGSCASAIQSIHTDGTASCASGSVDAISQQQLPDHGANFGNFGDFSISLSCGTTASTFVRILLFNVSGGPATLNFLYHNGATLTASGTTLANNDFALFDSNNGRIEGQFILAGPASVTTANLHAFKGGGSGCEIAGTTEKSTL